MAPVEVDLCLYLHRYVCVYILSISVFDSPAISFLRDAPGGADGSECLCVYMYMYMYMCLYAYIYMYIYICKYISISIYVYGLRVNGLPVRSLLLDGPGGAGGSG